MINLRSREARRKKPRRQGGRVTSRRQNRILRVEHRSSGDPRCLSRSLIIHKEKKVLCFRNRSAERTAVLILSQNRLRDLRRCRVEEEIVRIQGVVAEELVGISVIMSRAALQVHLDVASTVAARRRVIE